MIKHQEIILPAFGRGVHLITDIILKALPPLPEQAVLQVFIKHTSAGLGINENYDPSVLYDMNNILDKLVPENQPYFTHTLEGSDDMPAHAKSILVGSSVSIPIIHSKIALGTWQGIYLFEFRNNPGHRKLIASIIS